jgi:hypothetical protein
VTGAPGLAGRPAGQPREGRLLLLRFWVLSTAPSSNVPKQNFVVNLFIFIEKWHCRKEMKNNGHQNKEMIVNFFNTLV